MEQHTKPCSKCGAIKPHEQFGKRTAGKFGLQSACRDCERADTAARRKANPRSRNGERVRTPGEKVTPYSAANYAAKKAMFQARERRYVAGLVARTDEEIAAKRALLRPDGTKTCRDCKVTLPLDQFYEIRRKPDGLIPSCKRCWCGKVKGRQKAALNHWRAAGIDPFRCTYCSAPLSVRGSHPDHPRMHVDHVIPLNRGGTDDPDNYMPACPSCNCSKGDRDLAEWMQSRAA